MRDLKTDRAPRATINEERLRSTAGLRGSPALALSAWRGRSSRRCVVGVHDLTDSVFAEIGDAVVIAVRRDADGIAEPVDVASTAAIAGRSSWIALARAHGATELHVHRLAESEAERRAVLKDLTDGPEPRSPAPEPVGASGHPHPRLGGDRRGVPADALRDRGRGRKARADRVAPGPIGG